MADIRQDREEGKQRLWFTRRKGRAQGPFPSGSIRRFILLGRLSMEDEVKCDDRDWRRIAEVPEVLPPEIRDALKNGNVDELVPARMREDERSGKDRRATDQDLPDRRARSGERRKEEPDVVIRHRRTRSDLIENGRQRRFPLSGVLVMGMGVLLAMGSGLYLGTPPAIPDPECYRSPAPQVNWRNCILDGLQAESADLRDALLNNAILRGARFSGTRFNRADLKYANLTGADLSYADFRQAAMKGAGLRNADLSYSDLSQADLSFADLTGANLGGANLDQAQFAHAIWIDGRKCLPGSIGACLVSDVPDF